MPFALRKTDQSNLDVYDKDKNKHYLCLNIVKVGFVQFFEITIWNG
jgi:hypothetical protein